MSKTAKETALKELLVWMSTAADEDILDHLTDEERQHHREAGNIRRVSVTYDEAGRQKLLDVIASELDAANKATDPALQAMHIRNVARGRRWLAEMFGTGR